MKFYCVYVFRPLALCFKRDVRLNVVCEIVVRRIKVNLFLLAFELLLNLCRFLWL